MQFYTCRAGAGTGSLRAFGRIGVRSLSEARAPLRCGAMLGVLLQWRVAKTRFLRWLPSSTLLASISNRASAAHGRPQPALGITPTAYWA